MDASRLSFEWDEDKRKTTLQKHGLDFIDAIKIFAGPILTARSTHEGEERWISIGLLDGLEIAVIYTIRSDIYRIITARRARKKERDLYDAHYPARGA